MGIFDDEAERLLRTSWSGPEGAQSLAQELYSIFTSTGPIQISSPVNMTTNSQLPALTITNNFGDGTGVALNVNGGTVSNGDTVYGGSAFTYQPNIGGVGGNVQEVYFPAAGDPIDPGSLSFNETLGSLNFQPSTTTLGDGPPVAPPLGAPGGGDGPSPGTGPVGPTPTPTAGGGLVGIVQAGSGLSYEVTLYPNGFDRPAKLGNVTVNVPNLVASERLSPGYKMIPITALPTGEIQIDGTMPIVYYHQPPVWGA